MAQPERAQDVRNFMSDLTHDWGWMIVAGIGFIVMGVFALMQPIAASVAVTFGLGIVLIVAGVIHLIQAFRMRTIMKVGGVVLHGIVSLIAGFILLRYVAAGMTGITLALAFYLFMGSAMRAMLAMDLRPAKGAGWLMANSVVSFILGVLLVTTLPESAVIAPGVFLGVDLLASGGAMIGLGSMMRKVRGRIDTRITPEVEDRRRAA